jgi:outer membrane protein assembly factor BamB
VTTLANTTESTSPQTFTLLPLNRIGADAVGTISTSAKLFLFDPDNGLLYASEFNQTTGEVITAIDGSSLQSVGQPIQVSSSQSSFVLYDSFNRDIYFYSPPGINSMGGELFALNTESGSVVGSIPVEGFDYGLVSEGPSFVYDSANGDIFATEVVSTSNGTVGLLDIRASTNAIVSETYPKDMPLNYITLDVNDGILYGAYGYGSSTIFSLKLSTGMVTEIEIGDFQAYALAF